MAFRSHLIPLCSSVQHLLPVCWFAFRPTQRIKKWINESYILLSVKCQTIFFNSPKPTNVALKLNPLKQKKPTQLLKV